MKIAIVLGSRMKDDGTMSDACIRRCNLAVEILDRKMADKLVLSGGLANKNAGITESSAMFNYLVQKGISPETLIKEEQSLTTVQNAKFSVPKAIEAGAKSIIICTTNEHMGRRFLNPIRIFTKELTSYPDVSLFTYSGK